MMSTHGEGSLSLSFCEIVSTWFGAGKVSKAPGTAGSLAALLLFPLALVNSTAGFVVFLLLLLLGTFAVRDYMKQCPESTDPKEVVIDEVCGQLLTFELPILAERSSFLGFHIPCSPVITCVFLLSGFLSFRLFDIVKPWPICLVDRNVKGAIGVMLDDILAAVAASVVTIAMVNASM